MLFSIKKSQALPNKEIYWPEPISSIDIFEDTHGLPFDSINNLDPSRFQAYSGEQLSRNNIYWLRIIIDNPKAEQQNNYIHFNSLLSNVKLYQKDENNNYTEKIGGTFVPEKERTADGIIKEKVPFFLSDGNKTELFIRVCTELEMVYNLSQVEIISFEDYHQMIDRTFLIQSFFLGIIIILLLFNLTLFILTHDRLYLFYLLYIFFTSLFFVNFYQLSEKYLLFNFPKIDLSLSLSLTIAEAIYLWFFYEALKNEAIPEWREFIRKVAIVELNPPEGG
jgi:two-component system, sensor histidine kinase LadS